MGRPPSNGGPSFRFNPAEIAEMEAILQAHKTQMPAREVLVALAEKFSNSEERKGKIEVQMKQVWNWFQNRRYAIRAKAGKSPGKLNITQVNRDDPTMVKGIPQPTLPHAASAATVRFMPQAQQHPTVPTGAVRTFPQAPQNTMSFSGQSAGRVTDNSQMEYEAKSARDGAWYDVSTFLSHRSLDSGDPEVMVRFAGFGAEEDEWVNVRKNVRQRSLPCEASECVAVLPADLILCFQEGKEQALYFDAHVLDAQRRRHDVRGCRCRFLVRYDHDQSEEIVALRKICRRPETDYRLQQLHAVNESKNGGNSIHTVSTLRVYPPAEVQPKQAAVAVVPPAEAPLKRQKVEAQPGDVPLDQQKVEPVLPAPSLEPQKVETSPPVAASEPPHEVQAELSGVQPASAIESKAEVQTELPKVQPEAVESKAELSEVQQASEMEALETKDEVPLELPKVQAASTVEMKAEVQTELPQVQAADAIESKDEVQMELPQVQTEVVETKAELPQVQPPNAIETLETKTEVPPELPQVQSLSVVEMKAEVPQVQPETALETVDMIAEVPTELAQLQSATTNELEAIEGKVELPQVQVANASVLEAKETQAQLPAELAEAQPASESVMETKDEVQPELPQVQTPSAVMETEAEVQAELPQVQPETASVPAELSQVHPATASVMETEVEVPAELPQVQQPASASELVETEAEEPVVGDAMEVEAEVEHPKVSEMMETDNDGNDNRVTTDMEQV